MAKKDIPEADDVLILSVRLKSGKFESSLQVPLFAGTDAKQDAVDKWLAMIRFGFETGAKNMDATFDDDRHE